jgi:hypothetical protein
MLFKMKLGRKDKKKGKNPFEASMPVDNPDVKIVTASYKNKPFFIGIGLSKQREIKGKGAVTIPKGAKAEYQSQKDLDWRLLYNPKVLPPGFTTFEKAKEFMASTVAATSGNAGVYQSETKYDETKPEQLKKIEQKLFSVNKQKFLKLLREADYEIDHVVPISQGGSTGPNNIRFIKKNEHLRKHKPKKGKSRQRKNEKGKI